MPKSAGEEAMRGIEVEIQTGCTPVFPRLMRESRRGHRLIRRLAFAKAHVAINAQQRSARRFRIGDKARTDRVQSRPKVLDEFQERIAHEFFVAPLVLLKPFAVVVLAELPEKLEQLKREIGTVFHRSSASDHQDNNTIVA